MAKASHGENGGSALSPGARANNAAPTSTAVRRTATASTAATWVVKSSLPSTATVERVGAFRAVGQFGAGGDGGEQRGGHGKHAGQAGGERARAVDFFHGGVAGPGHQDGENNEDGDAADIDHELHETGEIRAERDEEHGIQGQRQREHQRGMHGLRQPDRAERGKQDERGKDEQGNHSANR